MAKHAGAGGPVAAASGTSPVRDQSQQATGPKHATSTRREIRRNVGIVLFVVVAGLAVGDFVISGLNSASPDRAAVLASSSVGEAPATTTPATSPARMPTASVAELAPSITVGSVPVTLTGPQPPLPQTGPGLTQPGILLIASPASDGSFDVVERVRLVNPVSSLTLRPAPVDRAGRQFAAASATAHQVQVSAGGQPVLVPGAEVGDPMTLSVAQIDQFELRYRLTDVTVRSTPSTAGRALAAIGPLTGGVAEDLPVLFIISGGTVLGLYCPLLPLSQQSCASQIQNGPGLERELPWRLALAMVQFNLPLP